ncbi:MULTISPECIES: Flp pilus assembly protein CpaB [Sutcliffiella]|nr:MULTISPECIES: SAF domain-containing protein [Sutcliffiella]WBL15378.1 SAF domain-containing protein [Sutcliffiella sp. NC1]
MISIPLASTFQFITKYIIQKVKAGREMLESKRRAIIFFTLSFLLAIAAGFLFLQKVSAINSELGGMTEIYIAAEDIPSRSVIQPQQLTTTEIPNRFVNESHITSLQDIANRVSVVPLSSGDIITKNMMKPFSSLREENNRLVTIVQSERIRFDERLEALDRIDIIVSHKFDGNNKTTIFMKDVLVAAELTSDGEFVGVAVEVQVEDAPELIHMQNYADSIRVLKANVGKGEVEEQSEKEIVIESPPEEEEIEEKEKEEDKAEEKEEDKESNEEDSSVDKEENS